MPISSGTRLERYEILSVLGSGGMGEVYLARDFRLNRKVALKVLPEQFAEEEERVRRFEQEALAASSLNHPNIVTIHEIGEAEAGRFIVMEFVEGCTLRTFVGQESSVNLLPQLGVQIAKALTAAHGAGIVHRDIKPENIMVRDDGYVKVLDFGLARLLPASLAQTASATAGATWDTDSGIILGTMRYLSPEQARGDPVIGASDIFSLGIVFYELVTGQHPFDANSPLGVLHNIISQTALSVSRLNPELPANLASLIDTMLDKDPRLRPLARDVDKALVGVAMKGVSAGAPRTVLAVRHTVGRQKERAELRAAFESTVAGHGSLLCVTGEPGIGKTTIVEDFLAELGRDGSAHNIGRGRCSERLAGTEAYLPLLEVLDSLLHGNESGARVMKLLAPTWYVQVSRVSAVDSSSERLLADVQGGSQERMKRELNAFFQETSRLSPLVLFFDDVHWADVSTVDLLSYLSTKFESARILVVVTYRPSELLLVKHPFLRLKLELEARGVCREIPLEFLSVAEIERYLALEFPEHRFPAEFGTLIHNKTEGNPLFMVDLVRYLRDCHVLAEEQGCWILRRSVPSFERELPASVRSMIEKKIDQLNEAHRRLLVTASIQGHEFDSAVVAKALGVDSAEAEEQFDVLERVFAFVRAIGEKEFPDRTLTVRYRFVHALYQNALYTSLKPTRRAHLSSAVAEALVGYHGEQSSVVASELARLFETARDLPLATEYYMRAAQNAAQVFAHEEAIVLARRGLELLKSLPDGPKRTQQELGLHLTLGFSVGFIRGWAAREAGESLSKAREICRQLGEVPQLFPVVFGLCGYYVVGADLQPAFQMAQQLVRIAETTQDPKQMVGAYFAYGSTLHHLGDLTQGGQSLERAIALYDPQQHLSYRLLYRLDPGVYSRCESIRNLWLLGYVDQAERMMRQSLDLANKVGDPRSIMFALGISAGFHQLCREARKAQDVAAKCMQHCSEHGLTYERVWVTPLHGWAIAQQGLVEDGIVQIRDSLVDLTAAGSLHGVPHFFVLLAEILEKSGRIDEGLAAVSEALDVMRTTGERFYEPELHRMKGELLKTRDPGRAEDCFHQAIEIARHQHAKSLELRATMSLARLQHRQGPSSEARKMLKEVYDWFSEGLHTRELREAKAVLEEIST